MSGDGCVNFEAQGMKCKLNCSHAFRMKDQLRRFALQCSKMNLPGKDTVGSFLCRIFSFSILFKTLRARWRRLSSNGSKAVLTAVIIGTQQSVEVFLNTMRTTYVPENGQVFKSRDIEDWVSPI